jgi:hypothetical protein
LPWISHQNEGPDAVIPSSSQRSHEPLDSMSGASYSTISVFNFGWFRYSNN